MTMTPGYVQIRLNGTPLIQHSPPLPPVATERPGPVPVMAPWIAFPIPTQTDEAFSHAWHLLQDALLSRETQTWEVDLAHTPVTHCFRGIVGDLKVESERPGVVTITCAVVIVPAPSVMLTPAPSRHPG